MWPFGQRRQRPSEPSRAASSTDSGALARVTAGSTISRQLSALADLGLHLAADADAASLQLAQDSASPAPESFQVLLHGTPDRPAPIRELVVGESAPDPHTADEVLRTVSATIRAAEAALGAPGHVTDITADVDGSPARGTVTITAGALPVAAAVDGEDLSPALDQLIGTIVPPGLALLPVLGPAPSGSYRRRIVAAEHAPALRAVLLRLARAEAPSYVAGLAPDAAPTTSADAPEPTTDTTTPSDEDDTVDPEVRRRVAALVDAGLTLDPRLRIDDVARAVTPPDDPKNWDPYLDAVVEHDVRGQIPAWENIFRFPPEDTMADSEEEWLGVVGDIARVAGSWDSLTSTRVVYERSGEIPPGIELELGSRTIRVEADVWAALLDLVAVARLCEALAPKGRKTVHLPNHAAWVRPRTARALAELIGAY
jgi:hypothetical protein